MCRSFICILLLALAGPAFGWWFGKPQHRHQQQQEQERQKLPDGIQATDLRMPGVIPQQNETYLCTSFPLDPEETHYIVGFEPLANSHQIHHVIVYGCDAPGSQEEAWDCGEMTSAKGRYSHSPVCASQPDIIYAWAHDAPKLILPEGVGFPVGGEAKSRHLVLQVHYMHKMDAEDQSGIRVLHTEEPQPRTAATLLLATDGHMPAKKTEQLEVACVVDEDVELHPFAFRVHTHTHGTNVGGWLVQQDPEGEDKWTLLGQRDPQLPQLFQPMANQSLVITQGDVLATRCTIRNNERREIKIGPTGEDEMCNFYLMYWTEGEQALKQNACFSPGPPEYRWTSSAGLSHAPKRK